MNYLSVNYFHKYVGLQSSNRKGLESFTVKNTCGFVVLEPVVYRDWNRPLCQLKTSNGWMRWAVWHPVACRWKFGSRFKDIAVVFLLGYLFITYYDSPTVNMLCASLLFYSFCWQDHLFSCIHPFFSISLAGCHLVQVWSQMWSLFQLMQLQTVSCLLVHEYGSTQQFCASLYLGEERRQAVQRRCQGSSENGVSYGFIQCNPKGKVLQKTGKPGLLVHHRIYASF